VYMTDKLIISNTDNYNQDFEFSDTKTYVGRYIELINEYMLYVVENMIIQDDAYLLFLIQRGVETIMHCFKFLLMYTKNLELTIYQCKKALYYYIEFIGQISDVSLHHSYLQLNSKDATLFVYKKTIYDINNIYRKNFIQSNNDKQFLNSISNIIVLFNATLFHLLQKERLEYSKKESIIHFAIDRAISITDKLFTKNNYFLTDIKTELCLFVFRIFQTYDIDTIKYSNICEIFIKKLRKYSENEIPDVKILLKEKLYNNVSISNLEEMSALRYINWILYPL
jgi:hypothetical protein